MVANIGAAGGVTSRKIGGGQMQSPVPLILKLEQDRIAPLEQQIEELKGLRSPDGVSIGDISDIAARLDELGTQVSELEALVVTTLEGFEVRLNGLFQQIDEAIIEPVVPPEAG